ncbi:hypothetical protein FOPE_12112 [Fonsecaea pedrosoi]|nr:hypothetical protein FOPE_12112 [Fonsecaea pedrosoi]
MKISSPWTLAAVQLLAALGPRAAVCAPAPFAVTGMGSEHDKAAALFEIHHPGIKYHGQGQGQGEDGQKKMMAPSYDEETLYKIHHPVPTGPESSASSHPGIETLFTHHPYTIPNHPLSKESESGEQEGTEEEDGEKGTYHHDFPTMSIPSRYYSTVLGRRLLALSSHGVLTSVFPSNLSAPGHGPPENVADTPIGLPEYIASCEEPSGNPTILSLKISTATRNAAAGSNVSLSLSWWDEYIHLTGKSPWALANLPRLSLTGYLEEIDDDDTDPKALETCFVRKHRDSVMWLPGRKWAAHESIWTRLVVTQAYWIGGFGDRNYIGWFDPEEWRSVKKEQWEAVRLPGEKA